MSDDPLPRKNKKATIGSTPAAIVAGILILALLALFWKSIAVVTSGSQATIAIEYCLTALVIIALNGIFVAGDTSIDVLKPSHAKALKEDDDQRTIFNDLIERKSNFVAACSLGSMTMRSWLVALAVVPAVPFSEYISGSFPLLQGWDQSGNLGHAFVLLVSVLVLAIPLVAANVVVGELIPRSYAAAHPLATSLRLYGAVRVFNGVFAIPIALFVSLAGLVTRRFGARATFAVANPAEEEIIEILEEAEETGEIEEGEREMVASVFEFGDTVAKEIMTPRADLEALPIDSDLRKAVSVVEESGHSRIPVFDGTDDTILGIVHAKDLMSAFADGRGGRPLREFLRPALFVPESKPLHDLLQEMRLHKAQIAIVQDEHSGTAGIVTIEDIVEEVMGEIVDEYDEDLPNIIAHGDCFESDGRLELDYVNDAVGSNFESEEFDTIGGFVFGLFGRQPQAGESVSGDGFRFEVLDTDGKRILRLRIQAVKENPAEREPAV